MKIAIVLSLVALAMATDFNMELNEGGKKFVEKINVDTEANTEEYSVPAHGNRVAIDILKDFTKGLKAEKRISKGACYITEISRDDEIPAAVQKEMELTKSKFPVNHKVTETMSLPLGEISEADVGSKIAAHCKGLSLVKVAAITTGNINEAVRGMLKRGALHDLLGFEGAAFILHLMKLFLTTNARGLGTINYQCKGSGYNYYRYRLSTSGVQKRFQDQSDWSICAQKSKSRSKGSVLLEKPVYVPVLTFGGTRVAPTVIRYNA